jgi:RNA polymerase sigma factor (TIGR02999 family)
MAKPSFGEVTQLLTDWSNGDQAALEKLMPLVYDELHRMAKRYMGRQHPGCTLRTTALIHEAYLRLVAQPTKRWQDRTHFFAVGAQAMRHVLVDYARSRHYAKRGGGVRAVSLDEAAVVSGERAAELVALDEALTELAALHPRQSQMVELRFFGGLSVEETAEVLKVSPDTVMRDWQMAKAWLHRELSKSGKSG